MIWEIRGNTLVLYLTGELDHHAAKDILTRAGEIIDEKLPLHCTLDLSKLSFMDSSGIAVLVGIQKRIGAYGGHLDICNLPRPAERLLRLANMDKLLASCM